MSRKFADERHEQAICLLVLYKHFVLSGQIEPDPEVLAFYLRLSPSAATFDLIRIVVRYLPGQEPDRPDQTGLLP
ncbi:hypothetical protein [Mesorhizobium escarrei]|uniref:Uncharacterized protein n=1 Tax=Mesorhizobium escarrei TaxID=666018 RepID=A0ABN8KIL7_9HYPH|nr:hypothetical protein MES5069_860049 [Mesorhizobium escarrei]